jgi:myosin heavy subunit
VKFRVEKKNNDEDGSSIGNPDVVNHASNLWGVNSKEIQKCLTTRTIGAGKEVVIKGNSVAQALDVRDAMTKRVYAELFQHVVDKINVELLSTGRSRHKFIGVLDIFGFESFETNSFEQLCINFCNEKLQFHFNEHIFKMEQALYTAEGITIPGSSFVDNQPTLDLLELKATGVFSMLDEEINVPKGSDEGFLGKLHQRYEKKHNNYKNQHHVIAKMKINVLVSYTMLVLYITMLWVS